MPLITAPSGEAIYKRAKRLDPEHFEGLEEEADIAPMFEDVVTPAIAKKYNQMTDVLIASQYPDFTPQQRADWAAGQNEQFSDSMMHEALAIVYAELVDSSDEWYMEQAKWHQEMALVSRKEELKQFKDLLGLDAPSNVNGFGVLTLDVSPAAATDEYSH